MQMNVTFSFQKIIEKLKRDQLRELLRTLSKNQNGKMDELKKRTIEANGNLSLQVQKEFLGRYMSVQGAYVLIML
jgi:hypothetical protein